jgi:thiamine-phosphate pyrophosphorylase
MIRLPALFAIVDVDVASAAGWPPTDLTRAFLAGGARLLQLRAKQVSGRELLELARAVVALGQPVGARIIVNDRADIARLAGAAGIHVGQEDLPPAAVRRVAGEEAIVGLSTHTPEQLEAALDAPVDYIAVGPVFGTATKSTGYEPIGLDRVSSAAHACAARGFPLVAIGGVTLSTAADVIRAGAQSVAVISDLLAGGDPEARVWAYLSRLNV